MPTLKLQYETNNRPIVELSIAGCKYRFLIDTGASHTILHPRILPVLCFEKHVQPCQMYGVGGNISCYALHVQFNFIECSISRVIVSDDRDQQLACMSDGIIGMDILQQFASVTINNKKHTITFEL